MFENIFNNFRIKNKGSNNIVINGRSINIPSGASITMNNGKIFVNEKEITIDGISKDSIVNIEITGNIESAECNGSMIVNGDAGSCTSGGGFKCAGNVNGIINAGGSVKIGGHHEGMINAGGSVKTN